MPSDIDILDDQILEVHRQMMFILSDKIFKYTKKEDRFGVLVVAIKLNCVMIMNNIDILALGKGDPTKVMEVLSMIMTNSALGHIVLSQAVEVAPNLRPILDEAMKGIANLFMPNMTEV